MAVIEIAKIQVRRGQEHVTGVPQLDPGEFGWAQDTQNLYIGKRIVEGANSDDNARILTDKDLVNLMHIFGVGLTGSAASTSTYRYQDELEYTHFSSTTTTIGHKLDQLGVSLTDFTQLPLNGTDITSVLQRAVQDIYANPYYGTSTYRTALLLPAGNFYVSGSIDLPPYAYLKGEGPGLTTLISTSVGTNLFRTVDGLGNDYSAVMQTGQYKAQSVSITDMTLSYNKNNLNDYALISFDNVENPFIDNVEFTTKDANISTSTYVSTGTAIRIRGNLGADLTTTVSRNAVVTNCHFKNMRTGVVVEDLVTETEVINNNFNYLVTGLKVSTSTQYTVIPQNTIVTGNEFNFVYRSALLVTTSTNRSNILSSSNTYINVGNRGTLPDQNVTYSADPVLQFNAPGNASVNDIFIRQSAAEASNTIFYNPLAVGFVRLQTDFTYNKIINSLTYNFPVIKIPVTGTDQIATVEYQLSNAHMSRKGHLVVNITADGFASVSDDYNWNEVVSGTSELFIFSTDMTKVVSNNYIAVTCSNFDSLTTAFDYIVNISV